MKNNDNDALLPYAEVIGEADRTIIFLHGWQRSGDYFRDLAMALQPDFSAHLLDLPGFGRSPKPAKAWGSVEFAECVENYICKLAKEQIILIGHSFGGRVSLRLAVKRPDLVSHMILIGSHGLRAKRGFFKEIKFIALTVSGKILKKIDQIIGFDFFKDLLAHRFGSRDYKQAGALKDILVKLVAEDQTESAKNISCQTLLIWGANDQETPPEMGKRLNKLIKNSHYIELEDLGHEPFNGPGLSLVAYHIKKFLASS
ncbi:MAG TPA: alpha/beta hydrolase [Oligoflexia bacterium]|nr:alpha/beta hydrolase [Oligoflexia bacterium]HMP27931.1 alpha/beta hydrolase [Oligoflexia bacterium]